MEKPRVTEIKVRMDCNGCVQKIKKVMHGIPGINDIHIDFPQQTITIIGWADPEKIVKAIKKTRKSAVICIHTEPEPDQSPQPPEPKPEEGASQPDPTSPPSEPPQTKPPEPPQDQPDPITSPEIANATPSQPEKHSEPKNPEEIHVVHHHPPDHGYRYAYASGFQQGHNGQFRDGPSQPPKPFYVTHGYNSYKPSPYVTEYAYPSSPPRYSQINVPDYNTRHSVPDYNTRHSVPDYDTRHRVPDNYSRDYYSDNNSNGNITSLFSEENPNACGIM